MTSPTHRSTLVSILCDPLTAAIAILALPLAGTVGLGVHAVIATSDPASNVTEVGIADDIVERQVELSDGTTVTCLVLDGDRDLHCLEPVR